jgi:hypothetical protein
MRDFENIRVGDRETCERGSGSVVVNPLDLGPRWGLVVQSGVYAVVCLAFMWFCLPAYTGLNRLMGCAVLIAATLPLVENVRRRRIGVPLVEIPLASYAVLFAVPMLFQEDQPVYIGVLVPDEKVINLTLCGVLLAVGGLWSGYQLAAPGRWDGWVPRMRLDMSPPLLSWVGASLLVCNALFFGVLDGVGEEMQRTTDVLISADLGLALLGIIYHQKQLGKYMKCFMWLAIAGLTLRGWVSGMTQSAIQPIFIFGLTRWIVLGKLPVLTGGLVVGIFFLLQPAKIEYRNRTWFGSDWQMSASEKVQLFAVIAWRQWTDILSTEGGVVDSVDDSATERLSLLLTSQQYFSMTPDPVPYKMGESVGYVFYGWVPRFIWPDKPIAQVANRDYPVEYGLQHPATVDTARFGVGHAAEGYINFGLWGMLPLFAVLGFMTRLPKLIFHQPDSSAAALGVQCFACLHLMFVGGSMGSVYGGLLTGLVAQAALLVGARWIGSASAK